ncbi:ThuA domain-containing protein [Kribbella albertanoniae]|nr:ThuA domain-containing protein [Kribbella albertanoniae]
MTNGIARRLGAAVLVRPVMLGRGSIDEQLEHTDVLVWPGPGSPPVDDQAVTRIYRRVLRGMGLVLLHPGQASAAGARLLSAPRVPAYPRHGERQVVWSVDPDHPIVRGVPNPLVIDGPGTRCEPSGLPRPDAIVLASSLGGRPSSTGRVFLRGNGRIFYFSPGNQDDRVYRHPDIQHLLANAVRWTARPMSGPAA